MSKVRLFPPPFPLPNTSAPAEKTSSALLSWEETWRPVLEFFEKSLAYLEMNLAQTIVVPGIGAKGAIRQQPQRLEEAYRLGARLAAERP